MRLESLQLYRYDLPLTEPLVLKGQTIAVRSGLVVKIVNNYGEISYGDIAPLHGFSPESLADAEEQLITVCKSLLHKDLSVASYTRGAANWFAALNLRPSVRFGIESALYTLVSQNDNAPSFRGPLVVSTSVDSSPPPSFRATVPVCGLVVGDRSGAVERARQLRTQGYRAVKAKVGRQPVAEDIALVHDLREALGNDIALRLDANRAWSESDANLFAEGIQSCRIEYIEEPLADPAGLSKLSQATGIPVALDESLVGASPETFQPEPGVAALILKPSFLGGVRATLDWAQCARSHGVTPVISAAFESGLGINALAQLAARTDPPGVPAGLDTYAWLAEDILTERLEIRDGSFDTASSAAKAAQLDFARLRKVDLG